MAVTVKGVADCACIGTEQSSAEHAIVAKHKTDLPIDVKPLEEELTALDPETRMSAGAEQECVLVERRQGTTQRIITQV
jgi:hypothetical protein